jgi:hypothetical protein
MEKNIQANGQNGRQVGKRTQQAKSTRDIEEEEDVR